MSYRITEMEILRWGEARQILFNAKPQAQLMKAMSEFGELADAEMKDDMLGIIDGVGDVMVCLILYCALRDIDLVACMESAYDEIKDRKGKLLPTGIFEKEEPSK